MQHYNINASTRNPLQASNGTSNESQPTGMSVNMQEAARAAERARLRQGIMHVRIRHFYCTLEEMFDPSLQGQCFVVGTGTGRPNEPGRVIDASALAVRLGVSPGMPLRRAHRIAPRTRFLPASYDRYQPILQRLRRPRESRRAGRESWLSSGGCRRSRNAPPGGDELAEGRRQE